MPYLRCSAAAAAERFAAGRFGHPTEQNARYGDAANGWTMENNTVPIHIPSMKPSSTLPSSGRWTDSQRKTRRDSMIRSNRPFYSAPILCDDVPATRPANQNSTLSFNVSSFSFGTVLHEKIGRTSPPVRTTRRSSEKRLPSASVTTGANGS